MLFREWVKNNRIQNKMTQEELGNLIGVTRSSISQYERGERKPDLSIVKILAKVFSEDEENLSELLDDYFEDNKEKEVSVYRESCVSNLEKELNYNQSRKWQKSININENCLFWFSMSLIFTLFFLFNYGFINKLRYTAIWYEPGSIVFFRVYKYLLSPLFCSIYGSIIGNLLNAFGINIYVNKKIRKTSCIRCNSCQLILLIGYFETINYIYFTYSFVWLRKIFNILFTSDILFFSKINIFTTSFCKFII